MAHASTFPLARIVAATLALLGGGCKVGGCAANVLGDVVGETGDIACDRRFVADGKERAPFCQEVIDTVATSQVSDDCNAKHGARTTEGVCPRDGIIAGCKIHKDNDDGSDVVDWYYDVSELEDAAVHDAASDGAPLFSDPIAGKERVRALCADPTRYEEGATFVDHP